MKITDLKCAIIGQNPVIRIITDDGIDGLGAAEGSKPYLKPMVMFYKDAIFGTRANANQHLPRSILAEIPGRRGKFQNSVSGDIACQILTVTIV